MENASFRLGQYIKRIDSVANELTNFAQVERSSNYAEVIMFLASAAKLLEEKKQQLENYQRRLF
ncbi:MAG: hypothetical protein BWY74_00783 [Firmicutes bacterium ADurb.Bin419]|nr:MAG: hypothetical protein BWY74_00783 [Firmicutes bacterium ADurb.Bin419]